MECRAGRNAFATTKHSSMKTSHSALLSYVNIYDTGWHTTVLPVKRSPRTCVVNAGHVCVANTYPYALHHRYVLMLVGLEGDTTGTAVRSHYL